MTNEMKLLRAFIEASGYEIEDIKILRSNKISHYKVTSKEVKQSTNGKRRIFTAGESVRTGEAVVFREDGRIYRARIDD